jgi:Putative Ig domain
MGTLPRGVILSKSGLILGTPKQAGTYTFTVKCLDASHSHKNQGIQQLTLTINP